ncbi:hypothetical protein Tco_0492295 [Tanacetum coccineum]
MLSFLKYCYVSTALTKSPSAYYLEYLKEFWYSAEVDTSSKTITFALSCSLKPLSFDLSDFSTIIGLKYSENYINLPPKQTVKAALTTMGRYKPNKTVAETQHAEDSGATADITTSLETSKLVEYVANQTETINIEKEPEHIEAVEIVKITPYENMEKEKMDDDAELVSLGSINIDQVIEDVSPDPEFMPENEIMSISKDDEDTKSLLLMK